MTPESTRETLQVRGEELVGLVERLIHEGNVRRIVVKQGAHTIVELPLTVGVIGAVLVPMLAVVSALAALLTDCTIEVERTGEPSDAAAAGEPLSAGRR